MLNKPKFKGCFHVETVDPESVFLLFERGSIELSSRLYKQLAPLIDSHHTVDEIIDKILLQLPPDQLSFQEAINTRPG